MKVWVVTRQNYDDYDVVDVFDSEDKADAECKLGNSMNKHSYNAFEFEIK